MEKIVLLDPLGRGKLLSGHLHYLRDWSGADLPGYIHFPPLELMCVASYLRERGYDVHIVEASLKHWSDRKILKVIKRQCPDFVFVPSTYFTLNEDKQLSWSIRKILPTAKIIFGGPLVTYDPSIVLSDGSADFVALGELELALFNILKRESDENVAYKNGNSIICGRRSLIDLNQLPMPARDLVDNQAYRLSIFNRGNPITAMTISRGCPHSKCKFCHSGLYSLGEIRYKDINSIIEEINEIVFKYKIGEIYFRDQVFTANRDLVCKFCEYLISRDIKIPWRVSTRVDLVDKDLLTLMHKAGCYQMSFGFESCSQKSLDTNDKGIKIEQSKQAAKWAKEAGLEVVGLFMFGMLGDTQDSIKNLYKFALDLNIDYAQFNEYFLVPGVPYYEEYLKNKTTLIFQKLAKKYAIAAYLKFYLRPEFLLKHVGKVKSLNDFRFLIRLALDEFTTYF